MILRVPLFNKDCQNELVTKSKPTTKQFRFLYDVSNYHLLFQSTSRVIYIKCFSFFSRHFYTQFSIALHWNIIKTRETLLFHKFSFDTLKLRLDCKGCIEHVAFAQFCPCDLCCMDKIVFLQSLHYFQNTKFQT